MKKTIKNSNLSQAEKDYWLDLLNIMTEFHQQKLAEILLLGNYFELKDLNFKVLNTWEDKYKNKT